MGTGVRREGIPKKNNSGADLWGQDSMGSLPRDLGPELVGPSDTEELSTAQVPT